MLALSCLYAMMTLTNWYRYAGTLLFKCLVRNWLNAFTRTWHHWRAARRRTSRLWTRTRRRCGWRQPRVGWRCSFTAGRSSRRLFSPTASSPKALAHRTCTRHRTQEHHLLHYVIAAVPWEAIINVTLYTVISYFQNIVVTSALLILFILPST